MAQGVAMHHRDRQHRPRAYNDPGHAHELTFSCYHKFPFLTPRTCAWLADAIRRACREYHYALWAYVFMPDHVHLVVHADEEVYNDSDFLKRVKEPVSRKAIQFLKKESPGWLRRLRVQHGNNVEHHFWQPGRGYDRNIIQSRTLLSSIDYIHENPVRRRLVDAATLWEWSSAGWFVEQPLNDLQPDRVPWEWLEETR